MRPLPEGELPSLAEVLNLYKAREATTNLYRRMKMQATGKPIVVCLCGSTRFKQEFEEANERETLAGRIVLTVGFFGHHAGAVLTRNFKLTPKQKEMLDELHLRKIEMANEVLILNVDQYVGASTKREAWYAQRQQKVLRWLVEPAADPAALVESWFPDWDAWRVAGAEAAR